MRDLGREERLGFMARERTSVREPPDLRFGEDRGKATEITG